MLKLTFIYWHLALVLLISNYIWCIWYLWVADCRSKPCLGIHRLRDTRCLLTPQHTYVLLHAPLTLRNTSSWGCSNTNVHLWQLTDLQLSQAFQTLSTLQRSRHWDAGPVLTSTVGVWQCCMDTDRQTDRLTHRQGKARQVSILLTVVRVASTWWVTLALYQASRNSVADREAPLASSRLTVRGRSLVTASLRAERPPGGSMGAPLHRRLDTSCTLSPWVTVASSSSCSWPGDAAPPCRREREGKPCMVLMVLQGQTYCMYITVCDIQYDTQ